MAAWAVGSLMERRMISEQKGRRVKLQDCRDHRGDLRKSKPVAGRQSTRECFGRKTKVDEKRERKKK